MDDADRKMWGTFILVGGAVISFALWRGAMYYYGADKPGAAGVSPKAHEAMMEERVREANAQAESGEDFPPGAPRTATFTGTFTPDQQQQILAALSPHRGCSVAIRPSQGLEGSSISTSGSKAAAERLASLFWKAGCDASIQEPGGDARSRGTHGLVIVVNPESPVNDPRGPVRGAQALADVLKKLGFYVSRRNSNRVDPKQFELLVGVEAP
ncbi:MAG: hypothetical protein ACRD24_08945 [Terriglobales bacterium]